MRILKTLRLGIVLGLALLASAAWRRNTGCYQGGRCGTSSDQANPDWVNQDKGYAGTHGRS